MNNCHQWLAIGLVASVALCGCGQYESVSPEAYQYSKALYSVCNQHDEPRLADVAGQIETAATGSQLTAREAAWLNAIVVTAQAGEWQNASRDARALMEAQVEGL
ncbi:MAG: hypothetical protein AAGD11_04040 [Planctomycetota bacterium]